MIVFNRDYDYPPAEWREASRREPCPVCEKPDWCSLSGPEGAVEAVVCMRIESDNRRKNGGWLHQLREDWRRDHYRAARSNGAPVSRQKPTNTNPKKDTPVYPTREQALAELHRRHGPSSTQWEYHNAEGDVVGVVVRWDLPGGKKDVRPIARHPNGWRIGGMPSPRPLYALPELHQSDGPVYVCEGEKAAEAARSLDLTATCSAHGSKSAAQTDWSPLAGREVVVLPDYDAPGAEYAETVVGLLGALKPGPTVRVVTIDALPGGAPIPEGGDLHDWIEAHGDAAEPEVMVANLEELVARAEAVDLPAARPQPPESFQPFPVDALPEPVRGFVTAGAAAIGCDPSFLALPLLTALGAAIGTTRRLALKRGWHATAILWTAIVGESGSSKSPAFKLVMRPVRDQQGKALQQHAEAERNYQEDLAHYEKALAAWKRDKKTEEPPPAKPEPPQAERFVVSDTTVEALAPILLANPRGVLLARDELAGWLGSFDRYSGGKGGADAAHWLSMHTGESIVVDRKTGTPRTIFVPEAAVWVTGGIQPAILHRALGVEHRESGLAARLLLACPPRTPKRWTEADIDPGAQEQLAALFAQLHTLAPVVNDLGESHPVVLSLSADAKAVWTEFYDRHAQEQAGLSGDQAAAWSKLEEYAARLALVVHLIRWAHGDLAADASEDHVVTAESMAAGVALVEWFKRETRRVYRLLGESGADKRLRELAEWIARRGGRVTARELQQGRRDCATVAEAETLLEELVQAGWGVWAIEKTATKPKRVFALSTASTSTD